MFGMQVYLVGGAVRDELLGLAVTERDWVVVGATPTELERAGYRAVGAKFPVFLHPETQEEYALARLERKVAPGYHGFVTEFAPTVTLEEDLQRRDLTINAMARAADGRLIDPYGGQRDLAARVLRHVSAAFNEDPVRLLRVARFAARFASLGFSIAPETLSLMIQMVRAGEANALVSERVWRELARTLGESAPERGFEVLRDCGAWAVLLPELQGLANPAPALAAMRAAADAHAPTTVRWAALVAALNVTEVDTLCARLRVPHDHRELAALSAQLRQFLLDSGIGVDGGATEVTADPEWLMTVLERADAFRRPERFSQWLQVLAAHAPAVTTLVHRLRSALTSAAAVRLSTADLATHRGPALAALLRQQRIAALPKHR